MKTSTKRRLKTQSVSDLPLFDSRRVTVRPNTMAGRFLTRRYRLDPAVADLIANLAGIGLGQEAR